MTKSLLRSGVRVRGLVAAIGAAAALLAVAGCEDEPAPPAPPGEMPTLEMTTPDLP